MKNDLFNFHIVFTDTDTEIEFYNILEDTEATVI